MTAQRFQIRIDPLWQPLLVAAGITTKNAYVEVADGTLDVHFGLLFQQKLRREEVREAVICDWPLWKGIGWRTNLIDQVGLIGSQKGVVELRLHSPIRIWSLLRCRRLAISLEEPGSFLETLAGLS